MAFALRPIRSADASAFFAEYACDAEATAFLPFDTARSVVETEAYMTVALAAMEAGKQITLAITDLAGHAIGNIEFRFDGEECEVGFALGRKHWNQGIMTRALQSAIEMVRADHARKHFFAFVDEDNIASRRVLEKNGFVADPRKDKVLERAKLRPSTRHMLYVELPQMP